MNDASNQSGPALEEPRVSLFGRRAKARAPSEPAQPQAAPPPPPRPIRKRRRQGLRALSGLLTFILIVSLIGMTGFVYVSTEANKPGPLAEDKVLVIVREDDGGTIPDQLERAGIIDNPLWFDATLWLDRNQGKLKRGEYLFKAHASLRDTEQVLASGKVIQHKFTVPEGLTSEQVVQRLRDNDVLAGDVKELPREGSILPETYEFERGFSRGKVIAAMTTAQTKAVDEIWKKRAPDLPIKSPGELVTLASIVEKETGKADERPHVAGVFINRLQKRMRLESDPTIVYGLVGGKGTLGHSISKAELLQATAYNTYTIEGLPPGPICNPGKAAMEAVANPMKTADLFFVADGTGGHAFAATLDEHQKNVAHWRQIEKDAKDKLAPDATPPGPTPPKVHGELDPVEVDALGAVAPFEAPRLTPFAGELGRRLARFGAFQQTRTVIAESKRAAAIEPSSEAAPARTAAVASEPKAAPAPEPTAAAAPEPKAAVAPVLKATVASKLKPKLAAEPKVGLEPSAAPELRIALAPKARLQPRVAVELTAGLEANAAPPFRIALARKTALQPTVVIEPKVALEPNAAPELKVVLKPKAAAPPPPTPAPAPFGALSRVASSRAPASGGDLARRLAKEAADQATREAMLGPNGVLSTSVAGATRSLADMGAVVQGVNDQQAVEVAAADETAATTGPVQSYPMSADALADLQSRAVRYGAGALPAGGATVASADTAPAAQPAPAASGARPRAFDASEGTALDPLRNKTYDLSYAKVVPVLALK